jgi:CRISPR-associated protein Cas6
MFWQENIKEEKFSIPETVMDLSFQISSKILPIDHADLLKNALCKHLDCSQKNLAFFDISVADGNGWEQDKKGFFYPSNRTKLTIRIRKENIQNVDLIGKTLDLNDDSGDYKVIITKKKGEKKLSDSSIIFSKMIIDNFASEDEFLQNCFNELQTMDITPKKMMAGLSKELKIAGKTLKTRSLMIADLSKENSVRLQENGLGDYQLFGCGVFVPQKGIDSVDAV